MTVAVRDKKKREGESIRRGYVGRRLRKRRFEGGRRILW